MRERGFGKYLSAAFCLGALCVLTLAGCAQYSKKEEAKQVKYGKQLMQDYLTAYIPGGKVTEAQARTEQMVGQGTEMYLSDYVAGTYQDADGTWQFEVNTETGKLYSSKYFDKLKSLVKQKILDRLGLGEGAEVSKFIINYTALPHHCEQFGHDSDEFEFFGEPAEWYYSKYETIYFPDVLPIAMVDVEGFLEREDRQTLYVIECDITLPDGVKAPYLAEDSLPMSWDGIEVRKIKFLTASGAAAESDAEYAHEGKAFDMDIVSDMYAEKGAVEISYGEGNTYSSEYDYRVPQIDEDTEGAREINGLIHAEFDGVMEELARCKEQTDEYSDLSWYEISYETFWNGSILSLITFAHANYEDYIAYSVYNYDAGVGMRISNEELLSMHHITPEDFITLARITAVKEFDGQIELYSDTFTDPESEVYDPGFYAEFMGMRMSTIQDNSLDVGMPLYLDGNGDLCVIVNVATPAGGGTYFSRKPLARDISEWETLKMVDVPAEYYTPEFNKSILRLYGETGYGVTLRHPTLNETAYESEYYFGFGSFDPSIFTFQDYCEDVYSLVYNGSLKMVGMDENGYIFEYQFDTVNDEPIAMDDALHAGRFYMDPTWRYNAETDMFEDCAVYRWIDGGNLFDTDLPEVELKASYG